MMLKSGNVLVHCNKIGTRSMTVHVPNPKSIDGAALAQVFTEARTHNAFLV
jgi:hypothetical protein